MKNIYILLIALLISGTLMAKAPMSFKYQAVVRNSFGLPITNSEVGLRISILQNSEDGPAVCIEEFTATTNDFGLVNLEIGSLNSDFKTINWSESLYFIKIELDVADNCSWNQFRRNNHSRSSSLSGNYKLMGISQLLSVPYALHSETADNYTETDPIFNSSVAKAITESDTARWGTDTDNKNELQNLSEVLSICKSAGGSQIKNLLDPTHEQDAATKAYVDAAIIAYVSSHKGKPGGGNCSDSSHDEDSDEEGCSHDENSEEESSSGDSHDESSHEGGSDKGGCSSKWATKTSVETLKEELNALLVRIEALEK